ncbi:MAG: DUF429 domain-containing protein, partial [Acidobacteriota bacterium]|nr:DUF429 domain-containing protein [Acidobacteriota bacterium]
GGPRPPPPGAGPPPGGPPHAGVSPEALRIDSDRLWAIERGFQLCAQNALDIASHLSSAAGLDPANYGSSIDCLVEASVLPPAFGKRFRGIAGFRNVLVHGYLDIDVDRLAAMLGGPLDDFDEFAGHVERWGAAPVEPESTNPHPSAAAGTPSLAIGVDGCPAGWFYVALEPSGRSRWDVVPTLADLVAKTSEPARVFVDIPIGLPDGPGPRECDRMARRALGGRRASSVFPAPARPVLDAVDYEDAKRRSRTATRKALSRQAFAILPRCREVDRLLRDDAKARRIVREIHPEVCFWAFAGQRAMEHNKKKEEGFRARIALLKRIRPSAERELEEMLRQFKRSDVARDDAVDALAAALTASAPAAALRTLPPQPHVDRAGLRMEMVYVEPGTM